MFLGKWRSSFPRVSNKPFFMLHYSAPIIGSVSSWRIESDDDCLITPEPNLENIRYKRQKWAMAQGRMLEKQKRGQLCWADDGFGEVPVIFQEFSVKEGGADRGTTLCPIAIRQGRIFFQRSSFELDFPKINPYFGLNQALSIMIPERTLTRTGRSILGWRSSPPYLLKDSPIRNDIGWYF